jgi:hypothetical protein
MALVLVAAASSAETDEACSATESAALLVSPWSVSAGDTFGVLAASETALEGASIQVSGPDGPLSPIKTRQGGGPPYWQAAWFKAGSKGSYRATLAGKDNPGSCHAFKVTPKKKKRKSGSSVWETQQSWDRGMENLYAAWIELLFLDADEGASWNPLHEVTRSADHNFLHDHLGLGEDNAQGKGGLKMNPDCADNPFFLRAYFAWKLGLPFGFHKCSRGKPNKPPHCNAWTGNDSLREEGKGDLQAFQDFLRTVMNGIHSASARTPLDHEATDLYPLPLSRSALRPGTVYADPYGHTLVIVRWIPQTEDKPGVLLAVDAQPDGTIGIKRFWRGNFLFAVDKVIGEPGFKSFRPVVPKKGELTLMTNKAIAAHKDYGDFSLDQQNMDPSDFYDTMDRLINPDPLDPVSAFKELHTAVYEQVLVRVTSVENGEKYMKSSGSKVVPMPSGAAIFQTTGPWEDYSTPSRDMRLLIALDVLLDFPDKVIRVPEAFDIPEGKKPAEIKKEIEKLHKTWSKELAFTYTRSDGTPKKLTLKDVIARMEALEMAYNPNDCVEIRWGAPEGSKEMKTCKRHAPADQRKKMESYRPWFHDRVRPV